MGGAGSLVFADCIQGCWLYRGLVNVSRKCDCIQGCWLYPGFVTVSRVGDCIQVQQQRPNEVARHCIVAIHHRALTPNTQRGTRDMVCNGIGTRMCLYGNYFQVWFLREWRFWIIPRIVLRIRLRIRYTMYHTFLSDSSDAGTDRVSETKSENPRID